MPRTLFSRLVPEGSSRQYRAVLVDHAGVLLEPASVTTITLTLRDVATDAIVNSRDDQPVKNANGGTLSAGGIFTQVFSPLDTASLSAASRQRRIATFKVVYTTGAENHEVVFTVSNLADVP